MSLFITFLPLIILLMVPVLIGVYVFCDAKHRKMNAVGWTLIAVIAPAFVGFIIYLVVRNDYSDLECPVCHMQVKKEYTVCPGCGVKLSRNCPGCGMRVEPLWKVCPKCASKLAENYEDVFEPIKKKDKMLGKILVAIIIVPVLLIVIMFISLAGFQSLTGLSGVTTLPVDEYLQLAQNPQIEQWLTECGDEYSKAYALRNERVEDGEINVNYLIYIPRLSEMPEVRIEPATGIFGNTLRLIFEPGNRNLGNTLVLVTCKGEKNQKLDIRFEEDQRIDCKITEVSYSLELTDTARQVAQAEYTKVIE